MQFNARQLMQQPNIETDLTTPVALTTLLIEHLREQGLDIPEDTLRQHIYIPDRAFHKSERDGSETLTIHVTDIDCHDDEALNELYYNRLHAFCGGTNRFSHNGPNIHEVMRRHLRDALRSLYGGKHISFARGPRFYDIYVIVDHNNRPEMPSPRDMRWVDIEDEMAYRAEHPDEYPVDYQKPGEEV